MSGSLRSMLSSILSAEFYILLPCVVLSFIIDPMLQISVIIGCALWLLRLIADRRFTTRTPFDPGIALLFLATLVSLWLTAAGQPTTTQVLRIWASIFLLYAVVNWATSRSRLRTVVVILILSGIAIATLALIGVDWAFDKLPIIPASIYDHLPSLLPGVFHRNVMAGYLVLLLPVNLALILFSWRRFSTPYRITLLLGAMVMSIVLLLSQSRGALIAFGAVLVLLVVLRWPRTWPLIPLGVLGGVILLLYVGVERVTDLLSAGVSLGGFTGRFEYWSRAIYIIQDFPWTGVGLGLFLPVVDAMYPFFIHEPASIPHAHNILLQVTVDLGIPGLVAWLSVFLGVVLLAWRLYRDSRRRGDPYLAGLGAGLLLSQVALLAHGMFDAVTWGLMRLAPMVWLVWGTAAAALILVLPGRNPPGQPADPASEDAGGAGP
jgi:putative inorganic carbon (HCO3(-)) transporter